ncbi:hypothetical protein E6P97_01150 [Patescibacteria group bacterium]|nr:MAG: hypothetical protein E6P97_01150 [Patescibacteria group bacterium]
MAEAQPRRLRAYNARSPHQKNPSDSFFYSPRRDFFLVEKGVFWWWRFAIWQNSGVNSTIMTSDIRLDLNRTLYGMVEESTKRNSSS